MTGPRSAGYVNYNTVAKKLDRRLAALGASAVCERGLGDDQHPNGYEAALDPWLRKLWSQLRSRYPLPPGVSEVSTLLTRSTSLHLNFSSEVPDAIYRTNLACKSTDDCTWQQMHS